MVCHYVKIEGEIFVIPYCYGSLNRNDLTMCSCNKGRDKKQLEERVIELEKQLKELKMALNELR